MSVVEEALRSVDWSGRQLLVACSGGVDSTVLLHGLVAIGLKPEVLHVNYGLRGAESKADETFVRRLAAAHRLTIHVHQCPASLLKGKGVNLQAAARDFRRRFFDEWTSKSAGHFVVLAHHADDQVETFFLQLLRGSGTFGLGGMHPERDGLIRPFLALTKEELRSYALMNQIEWREDQSNTSGAYLRNVWRNELLPDLVGRSATLKESVLLLMACFRNRQLELKDAVSSIVAGWERTASIDIDAWKALEIEEQLAFVHLSNLPSWTVDRIGELCEREVSSRFDLGNGWIVREKNRLIYHDDRTENTRWDFKIEEIGILPETFDKDRIFIDPAKLKGQLRLRPWRKGDRIHSVGLNGSQLVSDILKDAGIPFSERAEIQVLTDDLNVLWIPGFKVGRTALAGSLSATIWEIIIVHT